MARAIADGLSRNYPDYAATFQKNLAAYLANLDTAIARWQREATPLRGLKLVSYHPDMLYFAERFGMEAVGTIEIRAGIDPTPGHLRDRLRRARASDRHQPIRAHRPQRALAGDDRFHQFHAQRAPGLGHVRAPARDRGGTDWYCLCCGCSGKYALSGHQSHRRGPHRMLTFSLTSAGLGAATAFAGFYCAYRFDLPLGPAEQDSVEGLR